MTVQSGLCRNWSETQIVDFLTHRLIFHSGFPYGDTGTQDEFQVLQKRSLKLIMEGKRLDCVIVNKEESY